MIWDQLPVWPLLNDRVYKNLAPLIVIILCGELLAEQHPKAPHWFINPPDHYRYYYGVGISGLTYDSASCISEAKYHAAQNIVKTHSVRIKSGLADVQSNKGTETNFYINDFVDQPTVDIVHDILDVLDIHFTRNNVLVLCIIKKDFSKVYNVDAQKLVVKARAVVKADKPFWLDKKPKRSGYIYGISTGPSYYSLSESWDYSTKLARHEIAATIKSQIKSVVREYQNGNINFTEVKIEQKVDLVLNGSIVKERWYDSENYIYCTLVEYKIPSD